MALGGDPQPIVRLAATLGEGPVWDPSSARLWFVDIKAPALYALDYAGDAPVALERWDAPAEIGWVVPARDGTLLCGLADGLYRFSDGVFSFLRSVPGEPAGNRLNDACVDAAGHTWFGSMDNAETNASGRYFRYDGTTIDAVAVPGTCITNGPAIAPDQRTLYVTDTLGRRIDRVPLADGEVAGPPEPFATFDGADGYPDGPTVDAAGNLWTGLFAGHGVRCYAPDGTLLRHVQLPVANCTKIAFGGSDLRTAFVTTARKGLSDEALAAQPHAGSLFAFRVDTPGLAPTLAAIEGAE